MRTVSNLEINVFVKRIRFKGGFVSMLVQSTRILGKYFSLDENCSVTTVFAILENWP